MIPLLSKSAFSKSVSDLRSLRRQLNDQAIAMNALQSNLSEAGRVNAALQTKLLQADSAKEQLQMANNVMAGEVRSLTNTIVREAGYRKELLNLKGSFARTAFVLDTSGSMGTAIDVSEIDKEWGTRPAPWPSVQKRMDAWLMHLPIESFRIVCFSTELELFPKKESEWLQGAGSRNRAAEFLRSQSPGGFTCTEKAIDRALASKPTAIILFTDGMPSDTAGNADPAQQTRILNKVRTAKVPVHVVEVGNYFDQLYRSPELTCFCSDSLSHYLERKATNLPNRSTSLASALYHTKTTKGRSCA